MPVPKVPQRHWHRPPPSVRIITVPSGDAPLWVRQAWVGLELPTWLDGVQTLEVVGALSRLPRSRVLHWIRRLTGRAVTQTGYVCHAPTAIGILAQNAPDAAKWWRQNAPHFLEPHASFLFGAGECEPVIHAPPRPANT